MKKHFYYFTKTIIFLIFMFSIFINADLSHANANSSTVISNGPTNMLIYIRGTCSNWFQNSGGNYTCTSNKPSINNYSDNSAIKTDTYNISSFSSGSVSSTSYINYRLVRNRDDVVIATFTGPPPEVYSIYGLEWHENGNEDCTLTPKSSFTEFIDKFKTKFPFDIFQDLNSNSSTIDDCIPLTFGTRNYPICSIKPLIEIVKNIVLMRIVLNAFWTI